MNEDIERYVREHRCDFMELLCQIISLPSPTGHEQNGFSNIYMAWELAVPIAMKPAIFSIPAI